MREGLIKIKHIGLIMDGNRRWAKKHSVPLLEGHRRGEQRIEPIIDVAIKLGIKYLTFWAFSTENWNRTKREVLFLLSLYRHVLNKKIDIFHKKNVKINIIGDLTMFPSDIQKKSIEWMQKTKENKKITVNIALSYGGRDEIIRAINKWRETVNPHMSNIKIEKKEFEKYLDTANQPDPDMIIRTGGENRLSGFLLWQSEYSELYFTDILWPDFSPEEFQNAVNEYYNRVRRFGK